MRAIIERETNETTIRLTLELLPIGEAGSFTGESGIGFFDHMLRALCVHGALNLNLSVTGDLEVDAHHTVEDIGICFGLALRKALGEKSDIARFGSSLLPMDEALAECALDLSGRSFLSFQADFDSPALGAYDPCLTEEFFRALSQNAMITLHLGIRYGKNDHHKTEALFKAFALALKAAASPASGIHSSKGTLS